MSGVEEIKHYDWTHSQASDDSFAPRDQSSDQITYLVVTIWTSQFSLLVATRLSRYCLVPAFGGFPSQLAVL